MSRAYFAESLDFDTLASESRREEELGRNRFNINPELNTEENRILLELLEAYPEVFALNPKKPAAVKGIFHLIDTNKAQPVKQRAIPVAPAVEEEIMRQLDEMLQNGICRGSNSPWSSRVLLVTKKDGR